MLAPLTRGLANVVAQFPQRSGAAPCLVLDRLSTCTISELTHEALTEAVPNDVIAGVMRRFHGPLRGTALFALDPGDALLWLEMEESDEPPLERFVEIGGGMLEALVECLMVGTQNEGSVGEAEGSIGGAESSVGGAEGSVGGAGQPLAEVGTLEERPLVAALLATHAPSDTLILSIDGELAFELDAAIGLLHTPFTMQLLLEPKLLSGVFASLRTDD